MRSIFIMFRYYIKMKRGGGYISPKTVKTKLAGFTATVFGMDKQRIMERFADAKEWRLGNPPTEAEKKARRDIENQAKITELQLKRLEMKEKINSMRNRVLSAFTSSSRKYKEGSKSRSRSTGGKRRSVTRRAR